MGAALEHYLEADARKVDAPLVSDRLRSVARWYEDHEQLEDAFKLLTQQRFRDPLLFDPTLDRLAKKMIEREDRKK